MKLQALHQPRPRIVAATLIVVVLACLRGPQSAQAHASLVRSDPAPNAVLEQLPAQVRVWFDEPIEPELGHLEVFDAKGQRVDNLDTRYEDDAGEPSLVVSLPSLPNGTYVVMWRVVSVGDAHAVGGAFAFGVGEGVGNVALPDTRVRLDPAATAIGWLAFLGQAVLLGGFIFRRLVWRRVLSELPEGAGSADTVYNKRATVISDVVRAILVIGTVGTLFYQARDAGISAWTMLGTQWGVIWIARMVLVLGLAGFLTHLLTSDSWSWPGLVAIAGLLATTSLISHSASLGAWPLVAVDWLHLVSTSVWAGCAIVYALTARPALLAAPDAERARGFSVALSTFSWLAAAGVGGMLVSGATLAVVHLGGWEPLLLTAYGRAFQFKMAAVFAALLLGAANLMAGVTRPGGNSLRWPRGFWVRLGVEALTLSAVLGLTVWLTDLPRGANAPIVVGEGQVGFAKTGQGLEIGGAISPARVGGNQQLRVYVLGPYGQRVETVERVDLMFAPVGGGALAARVEATRQADGSYTANGTYFTRPGPWQLLVSVRLNDGQTAHQTFDMRVDPDGVIRPPGQAVPWSAGVLGWLGKNSAGALLAALVGFAAGWAWLAWRAAPRGNRSVFAGLLLPSVLAVAAASYLVIASLAA